MSYSYFLARLKQPYIESLKDLDSLDRVEQVDMSMESVKDQIMKALPEVTWDEWVWREVDYPGGSEKTLCSQALDTTGRFEIRVSNYQFLTIDIDGSHHVDQRKEVTKIAKSMKMSAIDIQTGDIIYLQEN
jgi:hypothetical protein